MNTPYPFQEAAVSLAVGSPGARWLFADEMGLGKTGQAILACRRLGVQRILVVTPALARLQWTRQFKDWPGYENVPCGVIDQSPDRKAQSKKRRAAWPAVLAAPLRILSPGVLDTARERTFLAAPKTAVILDEIHLFQNPSALCSQTLWAILKDFRGPIFGTSATPIPDRVLGLWHPLHLLCPGRFGWPRKVGEVPWVFRLRYAEQIVGPYGSRSGGLRPDRAAELRMRLSAMMSRTTRLEVAHLLPPCQVRTVPGESSPVVMAPLWVESALNEVPHAVILTHFIDSAHRIHEAVLKALPGVKVAVITGKQSPAERADVIEGIKAAPRGVLIATMHCVARAISLSWATRALFAELYWRPEVLVQALGRFARLDGHAPALIDVMCGGELQERMANVLATKLADQRQVMSEGAVERGLGGAASDEARLMKALAEAAEHVASDYGEELDDLPSEDYDDTSHA